MGFCQKDTSSLTGDHGLLPKRPWDLTGGHGHWSEASDGRPCTSANMVRRVRRENLNFCGGWRLAGFYNEEANKPYEKFRFTPHETPWRCWAPFLLLLLVGV